MDNCCRHFLGLRMDSSSSCARGWDIRKWAMKCNGGSSFGIGLRLPCTKKTGAKPLFDCPSVDRRTDVELAKEKAETDERIQQFFEATPLLSKIKEKMIANRLSRAIETCPWCDVKDAFYVSVAIDSNNHMHGKCKECKISFME